MASNARRLQRERVAKMTLGDLSDYFHIPIKETAKLLEVSTSVVKKVCRKAELYRWPQRKVKSNMRKITVLRRGLANPGTREKTRVEIQRLQQEMVEYCGGLAPTGIEMLQV
ncbi:protein RKD3-like [Cajanus cajan]|nr:protein RKD3-like [Cajanus cajan]